MYGLATVILLTTNRTPRLTSVITVSNHALLQSVYVAVYMSNARSSTSMKEWKDIPWRKLERYVFKLQKRIFKASERGDVKVVKKLQKTLMRSWSSKCLAVRRVTQDNQGKKTAGVDGVKSLKPEQRLELVNNLELSSKAKPTFRVWIPKPGTNPQCV
jgi:RNA-directed DNA polymerase